MVYYYFASWQKLGLWQRINNALREETTQEKCYQTAPSPAILDAQTVKMADQPGARGFDAGKKVMGRKRTFWLTAFGLILVAVIHSAVIQVGRRLRAFWPF